MSDRLLAVLLAGLAGAAVVVFTRFPRGLSTAAAPHGILSFELPRTSARAAAMTEAWRREDKLADVERSLRIDRLFIPLYVATLAVFGVLAARAADAHDVLAGDDAELAGTALVAAACAAGALDVLENLGMRRILDGHVGARVAALTTLVAALKWLLASLTALYAACLLGRAWL